MRFDNFKIFVSFHVLAFIHAFQILKKKYAIILILRDSLKNKKIYFLCAEYVFLYLDLDFRIIFNILNGFPKFSFKLREDAQKESVFLVVEQLSGERAG